LTERTVIKSFVRDQVWVGVQPLRYLGVPIRARTTIVRLHSGALWVHSPITPVPTLRTAVDALGDVRHIVAPSSSHHLFVEPFARAYPKAFVHAPASLAAKHPALRAHRELSDAPDPAWEGEIDQIRVRGHRWLDEVVFFHRASRTLIVTDLLESAHRDCPPAARLAGIVAGVFEEPGPPLAMRLAFTDPEAASASMRAILKWDFDRIVLAHGHVIEGSARACFAHAYRFLL
jgi:hypothetical protein